MKNQHPRPHERQRLRLLGTETGMYLDYAWTPDGHGYCLHVFDEGAKTAHTLDANTAGKPTFPLELCVDCYRLAKSKQN